MSINSGYRKPSLTSPILPTEFTGWHPNSHKSVNRTKSSISASTQITIQATNPQVPVGSQELQGPIGPPGPTGPQGEPGQKGEKGDPGPAGLSTLKSAKVFFSGGQIDQQILLDGTETTILNLSNIETEEGERVSLDSMLSVGFKAVVNELKSLDYRLTLVYRLKRDGSTIGFAPSEALLGILDTAGPFHDNHSVDRTLTPNLTWVDIPVPGRHTYELTLQAIEAENINFLEVDFGVLKAVLL